MSGLNGLEMLWQASYPSQLIVHSSALTNDEWDIIADLAWSRLSRKHRESISY